MAERRTCPTETEEEIDFCDYCNRRGFTHFHVPQETYTDSWKQKAKNKAQGVLEGVSDHWVILPTKKWGTILLVIEFKRQFGNTPTDAQIDFLHKMDAIDNVVPFCAYGWAEAAKVIEELEQGLLTTLILCEQRMEKLYKNRQNRQKSPKKPQNVEKKKNNREELEPAKNNLPY